MDYLLQYAGIPFVSDVAQTFRMSQTIADGEEPRLHAPKNQQPLPDLIDELNRILPSSWLTDFAPPSEFPGRNLSAIARNSATGDGFPNPSIQIGDWFWPRGAQRWSVFRGLATSSAVKAMIEAVTPSSSTLTTIPGSTPSPYPSQRWTSATFTMKADPITPSNRGTDPSTGVSRYLLQTPMFLLPPRPLAEHGGGFDGLYLVTLVDERYWWQFSSVSLHPNQSTTWGSLLAQIASTLNVTLDYSPIEDVYGQPEPDSQLWTNVENPAVLLDAIAANVGRVVVRKLDGTIQLQTAAASAVIADANRNGSPGQPVRVVRTAGGEIFTSGVGLPVGNLEPSRNAAVPFAVQVTFPKYVALDNPVPHFVNQKTAPQQPSVWFQDSYGDVASVTVPIMSGGIFASGLIGTSGYSLTVRDTAKALLGFEADTVPVNASGLTALGMKIAGDYYGWQLGPALDEAYPGTFAWTPEGHHDIVWTYSARVGFARTRVMRTQWNAAVDTMQHATPIAVGGLRVYGLSGSLVQDTVIPRGVGGPLVAQTWRDSLSGWPAATYLCDSMAASGNIAYLQSVGFFPTYNRWRGRVGNEVIVFEGTSGGLTPATTSGCYPVNVVSRGMDGTAAVAHYAGEFVSQVQPDTSYGVNLVTAGKNQFTYPDALTSGGITGAVVVPQTQTVFAFTNSGVQFGAATYYSGCVVTYDPLQSPPFRQNESVWIIERNAKAVSSGSFYDGQFVNYSPLLIEYNAEVDEPDTYDSTLTSLGTTLSSTLVAELDANGFPYDQTDDFEALQEAFDEANSGGQSLGALATDIGAAFVSFAQSVVAGPTITVSGSTATQLAALAADFIVIGNLYSADGQNGMASVAHSVGDLLEGVLADVGGGGVESIKDLPTALAAKWAQFAVAFPTGPVDGVVVFYPGEKQLSQGWVATCAGGAFAGPISYYSASDLGTAWTQASSDLSLLCSTLTVSTELQVGQLFGALGRLYAQGWATVTANPDIITSVSAQLSSVGLSNAAAISSTIDDTGTQTASLTSTFTLDPELLVTAPVYAINVAGGDGIAGSNDINWPRKNDDCRWYTADTGRAPAEDTQSDLNGYVWLVPFITPAGGTPKQIGAWVESGFEGETLRFGIYERDGFGGEGIASNTPGQKIFDSGELSAAVEQELVTADLDINFTAGELYWLAIRVSSSDVELRAFDAGQMFPVLGTDATLSGAAYGSAVRVADSSTDSLPSTITSPEIVAVDESVPVIAVTWADCEQTTTTTTTTPAPCLGACRWEWDYTTLQWELLESTCAEDCNCIPPTYCGGTPDLNGFTPICEQTITSCTSGTPSDGPDCDGCTGQCTYIYSSSQGWMLNVNNCCSQDSSVSACGCVPPTGTGTPGATTTAPCVIGGTTNAPCTGGCNYTCLASTEAWSKTSDSCGAGCGCIAPSNSTGCTPGNTTVMPCGFANCVGDCLWTWSGNVWTLTSSACAGSSSCGCVAPSSSGSSVGQTRRTPCGGTTGATTGGPTTTTTISPSCTGCTWYWTGTQWVNTSDNCTGTACRPCPNPGIPNPDVCVTYFVPCDPPPPPPPPPPPCSGCCTYYWPLNGTGWSFIRDECNHSVPGCVCSEPSFQGADCQTYCNPCGVVVPPGITTTIAPGATTTPNPINPLCTTTTTSAPGVNDCDSGACYWRWDPDEGEWVVVDVTCPSNCGCPTPPAFLGASDCDTAVTDCGAGTTSPPCSGDCTWRWAPAGGPANSWNLVSCDCTGGSECGCVSPFGNGTVTGQTTAIPCLTPGTTGCPVTTTTTTAAPCLGACQWKSMLQTNPFGYGWVLQSGNCAVGPTCCGCVPPNTPASASPGRRISAPCSCGGGCTGTCKVRWNGASWDTVESSCTTATCQCVPPSGSPSSGDPLEQIIPCTSMTTTVAPTTTPNPTCSGTCYWVYLSGQWNKTSGVCTGLPCCTCSTPTVAGSGDGQVTATYCSCTTPTTTSTPYTTCPPTASCNPCQIGVNYSCYCQPMLCQWLWTGFTWTRQGQCGLVIDPCNPGKRLATCYAINPAGCDPTGFCPPECVDNCTMPTTPGSFVGQVVSGPAGSCSCPGCGGGTTTATPTTTTTTTTAAPIDNACCCNIPASIPVSINFTDGCCGGGTQNFNAVLVPGGSATSCGGGVINPVWKFSFACAGDGTGVDTEFWLYCNSGTSWHVCFYNAVRSFQSVDFSMDCVTGGSVATGNAIFFCPFKSRIYTVTLGAQSCP